MGEYIQNQLTIQHTPPHFQTIYAAMGLHGCTAKRAFWLSEKALARETNSIERKGRKTKMEENQGRGKITENI